MYKLRDYQLESVKRLAQYYQQHPIGYNPLLELPTAAGKSVILATIANRIAAQGKKALFVTHSAKLVEQNYSKFVALDANNKNIAGICCSGLGRKDLNKPIIYGTVQTLARMRSLPVVDYLAVDECHLMGSKKADAQYNVLWDTIKANHNAARLFGVTATPYRLNEGSLIDGQLFHGFAHKVSIQELLDNNYIVPLVSKPTSFSVSTQGLKTGSNGNYNLEQTAHRYNQEHITRAALLETIAVALECGRKHWLIFTTSIDHANNVHQMLLTMGISAGVVHSQQSATDNRRALQDFERGHIRALVNVDTLTTGYDCPHIDLIVFLRPTMSRSLWVQMLGRGVRLHGSTMQESINNGKVDCMVLDFATNLERLGGICTEYKPKRKRGAKQGKQENEEEKPTHKECPNCSAILTIQAIECSTCGYEYPSQSNEKMTDTASILCPMYLNKEDKIFTVLDVGINLKVSKAQNFMLVIGYRVKERKQMIYEYITLGMPKGKRSTMAQLEAMLKNLQAADIELPYWLGEVKYYPEEIIQPDEIRIMEEVNKIDRAITAPIQIIARMVDGYYRIIKYVHAKNTTTV